MSDSKKNSACYGNIIEKIKALDLTIRSLHDTITNIKGGVSAAAGPNPTPTMVEEYDDELEEICMDEIESERAILEIMKNACLDSMHGQEPEGEG
jgi:nitrogen-specific signal transduction histidine kinase